MAHAYAAQVKPHPTSGATRGFTWGGLFALLWALANIVHLLNMTAGQLSAAGWVNLAAALWLLAAPGSAARLVALAATQLLDTVVRLPFAPDHQILAAAARERGLAAARERGAGLTGARAR